MTFAENTNSSNCPYSIVDEGDCCCNCKHYKHGIHPLLGFVGWYCMLGQHIMGEDVINHLEQQHGMCECHERVEKRRYEKEYNEDELPEA